MTRAQALEDEENYEEARELYLTVAKEAGGEPVLFYWRAQASAWLCLFKLWSRAEDAQKAALEPEVEKAAGELEKIVPQALLDEDFSGAAVASLGLGQIHFNFERWEQAAKALEVFTKELDEEKSKGYRCLGLGYLILAYTRIGDCDSARKHFLPVYKGCGTDAVVAFAAQALTECYLGAGDPKRGSLYLKVYLKHPSAADDLKNPQRVLEFARIFIQGGRFPDADALIKTVNTKDANLKRQLLVIQAQRQAQQKKWKEVVATLEQYVEEYQARGDYLEDPEVRRDLAEAYIARGQPRPPFKDYESAKKHYSAALAIMKDRLPQDPKLERTFFRWALRYCKLLLRIGDAGQPSAYGEILLVVDAYKHKEMGGLRDDFLKIRLDAEKRRSVRK